MNPKEGVTYVLTQVNTDAASRVRPRANWTITEEVVVIRCRNCRETEAEHAEGKCLFEATSWDPLSYEESRTLKWEGLAAATGDYLHESLQAPGFSAKLKTK